MDSKILIIGSGNIGSRHLQGILKLSEKCSIQIVEPNESSKTLTEMRLQEDELNNSEHSIEWFKTFSNLDIADLVIVSTPAHNRLSLIQNLLEQGQKRFLLEKIVVQSKKQYGVLLNELEKYDAKAWVNTNRRYFPAYQKLKNILEKKPIQISVLANNRGLGTNLIHFIDLFLWFISETKINLNGDFLIDEIFPNKRGKDLMEFAGLVSGTANGSMLTVSFLPMEKETLNIQFTNNDCNLLVDEIHENIVNFNSKQSHNIDFKNYLVSELTTNIVQDILESDNCLLPQAMDLQNTHEQIFNIFNNHIEKLYNKKIDLCPIT